MSDEPGKTDDSHHGLKRGTPNLIPGKNNNGAHLGKTVEREASQLRRLEPQSLKRIST